MHLFNGNSRAGRVLPRASLVIVGVLVITAYGWLMQPGAPADLRSAQPDLSAHVGRAPEQVRLGFGQAVVPGAGTTVTVLGPDDENLARGPALPSSTGISQAVAPLGGRGAYQVVYRVQLLDGDVASGQYWFWYAPEAAGATSRPESPALLGLLVALVAALAAGLLAPGRGRQRPVTVPAQRTGSPAPTTSTHPVPVPVPVQRSRDSHVGVSPRGSSPRARSAPSPATAEPTKPIPPRNP